MSARHRIGGRTPRLRLLPRMTAGCAVVVAAGLVPAVAAPVVALSPATAQAASSRYRYWTYWKADRHGWSYATVGPASVPPGGSVEGWRFEVSTEGGARPPRRTPDFAAICGGTSAANGRKRVALVLDYGTPAAAPSGETPPARVRTFCVVVPQDATGYDVLNAHASVRTATSGLVCAVGGYPRTGCGEAAGGTAASQTSKRRTGSSTAAASRDATATSSHLPYGTIAGVVAAVALGGAAIFRARRRT